MTTGLFDIFVAGDFVNISLIDKERCKEDFSVDGNIPKEKRANSITEHAKRINDILQIIFTADLCAVL